MDRRARIEALMQTIRNGEFGTVELLDAVDALFDLDVAACDAALAEMRSRELGGRDFSKHVTRGWLGSREPHNRERRES